MEVRNFFPFPGGGGSPPHAYARPNQEGGSASQSAYLAMSELGSEKSVSFFILGLAFLFLTWFLTPPKAFPTGSVITVSEGSGLYTLAEDLREEGVIRSPFWFRAISLFFGRGRTLPGRSRTLDSLGIDRHPLISSGEPQDRGRPGGFVRVRGRRQPWAG